MRNELYRAPAGEEIEAALAFLSRGIGGAEAYTFLRLNREALPEGRFWCAAEQGEVKSVVYHNGDRVIETAPGVPPYPGLRLLRFAGALPPPDPRAVPLGLKDAEHIYRVISGKNTLSPDEQARYVFRARAMRDGLACGYGVKENGSLCAFAFIAAGNADAALLGDVFTAPPYRGRGYAAASVLACAAKAIRDGKTAWVLCEDKNLGFYGKLGFTEDELQSMPQTM